MKYQWIQRPVKHCAQKGLSQKQRIMTKQIHYTAILTVLNDSERHFQPRYIDEENESTCLEISHFINFIENNH